VVNFNPKQQFRSSEVQSHVLQDGNLVAAPDAIEKIPVPFPASVGRVDRFGSINFLCRDTEAFCRELLSSAVASHVNVQIGTEQRECRVALLNDLKDFKGCEDPNDEGGKKPAFYRDDGRDGRLTLAWPWPEWLKKLPNQVQAAIKVQNSPFYHFRRPPEKRVHELDEGFIEEGEELKIVS
jgi:hypothetical protein